MVDRCISYHLRSWSRISRLTSCSLCGSRPCWGSALGTIWRASLSALPHSRRTSCETSGCFGCTARWLPDSCSWRIESSEVHRVRRNRQNTKIQIPGYRELSIFWILLTAGLPHCPGRVFPLGPWNVNITLSQGIDSFGALQKKRTNRELLGIRGRSSS